MGVKIKGVNMKVLGIDTSTRACSVALVCEYDGLLAEYTLRDKRTHSEKLMPLVDKVLSDGRVDLSELSGISAVIGPGSFTGLRIGLATAQGLTTGYNLDLVGVPTLDVLAYGRPIKGLICPVLDARKGEVYTCLYQGTGSGIKRLWEYRVISMKELFSDLEELSNSMGQDALETDAVEAMVFTGDGVAVFREELMENTSFEQVYTFQELEVNRASITAKLGLEKMKAGNILSPHELNPLYIRKSEAEKNLHKKG